ncbi:MAG: S8 family serine peptidase [Anaerolineae bacterium]
MPPHLQEVPDEIQELFADGMSAEKFVEMTGYVPRALEGIVDGEALMIIELEAEPLSVAYAQRKAEGRIVAASTLDTIHESLKSMQEGLKPQLTALGAKVISQYTVAYNGFQAMVPLAELNEIRALPGVKAVHRAPIHEPALGASVPLIRASEVWEDLDIDGEGVTIAVIDTGIDYTHAAFGGPGTEMAYNLNNPDVIESGTFPTAKVIDGYDFAGTDYDADGNVGSPVPSPDPDPLDEHYHGTHVSSIAAGIGAGQVMTGVAPAANLIALKVFGAATGATTALTLDALEWATLQYIYTGEPQVINMSLGSPFGTGDPADPSVQGTQNAVEAGIVVVASAGNTGDSSYVTGSPGSADRAISVAGSTTGYATGPTVSIVDSTVPTQTNIIYNPSGFDAGGKFTTPVTAPLGYVGYLTTTNTLCSTGGIAPDALEGEIALISRGGCAFSDKVNNAASLGAVAAFIYNNEPGIIGMIGTPVSIPAGSLQQQDGLNLIPADGEMAHATAEDDVQTVVDPYTPADTIATFSSRGPRGVDSFLKPEVTAPGVAIFAAAAGTGVNGQALGGTSMAAPHVAGVAALLAQAKPDWTPEQIKAAMMNTAVSLVDDTPIPRSGAGRVDAYRATDTDVVAIGDEDLVSLNWGVVLTGEDLVVGTKHVTLYNDGDSAETYDVAADFQTGSLTAGASLTVDPAQVEVPVGGTAMVTLTLTLDTTAVDVDLSSVLEEYYGFVTLTPDGGTAEDALRVPFYLHPRPFAELTVDANASIFDPASDMLTMEITHTGPVSSSLWLYPALYKSDAPDPAMAGPGDVRMFGLDYGWFSDDYGDILVAAIDAWDYWHVPQPFFAEFDLYIDADQDGTDDYVNFNYNYGWFSGGDYDNTWVILQVDLSTGNLYLASPYLIYTDYNASFMEWYFPAVFQDLGPSDSDFAYQLYGFDEGGTNMTPRGEFDYQRYPFDWGGLSFAPGPADPVTMGAVWIANLLGYRLSEPEGVMLVDYHGDPSNQNGGQAYFLPLRITGGTVFLPLVINNFTPTSLQGLRLPSR